MPRTDLLTVLRNRWLIVLLGTVLGATCAYALTATAERLYTSTSSLYFSINTGNTATELNQGASYVAESMNSFAGLAASAVVLREVRDDLGLDDSTTQLGRQVTPSVRTDTVLLDIDVTTDDRQRSADIANAVAAATGDYARATAPTGPEGEALLRVETVREASPSSQPSSPQTGRDVVAGMLVGLFAGLALGAVREQRDDRLRRSHELFEITRVPVLAILPGRSADAPDRDGLVGNAHRRLRLGLQAHGDSHGSLIVAGIGRPGATGVARGLATAYAETGAAVIHVDAERSSEGSGPVRGLYEVVLGEATLDDVLVQHADDAFVRLPARASRTQSPILASPSVGAVMDQLARRFDVVIVSCSNVTASADAAVLAKTGGRVLLVAVLGKDHLPVVVNAVDDLAAVGAPPLGFIAIDPRSGSGHRPYRDLRAMRPVVEEAPDDSGFHEVVPAGETPSDPRLPAAAVDVAPGRSSGAKARGPQR